MEISIHKSLKHPYIVQFKHKFEDDKAVYIIMELCPNQTLMELLKREKHFDETNTRKYMSQLISAVKYLHCNQIIHRDLKLGNLFLDKNWDLKLGDFGLAAKLSYPSERKRTVCGTPNYIAPEVIHDKGYDGRKADIWSIGVILFVLLAGYLPFDEPNMNDLFKKITEADYTFPSFMSDDAKDLISRILNTDPNKRISLEEVLESPWIKKGTSSALSLELLSLNARKTSPSEVELKNAISNVDIYEYDKKEEMNVLLIYILETISI